MIQQQWCMVVFYSLFLLTTTSCLAGSKNNKRKKAFVTIVTDEEHIEPAMVMGSSLRAMTRSSTSSEEYICLVLRKEDIEDEFGDDDKNTVGISLLDRKKLTYAGWTTRPLSHSITYNIYDSNNDLLSSSWNMMDWNQLWLWSLEEEYERILYLDVDILILQNVTDLFQRNVHFAAAPQLFSSHQFDIGVMVVQPNIVTFEDMLRKMKTLRKENVKKMRKTASLQDFLNDYFSEWNSWSIEHRLSPIYNAPFHWTQQRDDENSSWKRFRSDIKLIHFTDGNKPWHILRESNPSVSKYGAPIIYVWAIVLYFIANPLVLFDNKTNSNPQRRQQYPLEEETRYVLTKVFDITKSSKKVAAYMEKIKRGGTRSRIGHDGGEL